MPSECSPSSWLPRDISSRTNCVEQKHFMAHIIDYLIWGHTAFRLLSFSHGPTLMGQWLFSKSHLKHRGRLQREHNKPQAVQYTHQPVHTNHASQSVPSPSIAVQSSKIQSLGGRRSFTRVFFVYLERPTSGDVPANSTLLKISQTGSLPRRKRPSVYPLSYKNRAKTKFGRTFFLDWQNWQKNNQITFHFSLLGTFILPKNRSIYII